MQRKELPLIVRQSARRTCVHLARVTAPFGLDSGQRLRIIKNINSDISRVFATNASVSKNLEEENRKQLAFLTNNKTPSVITKFLKSLGLDLEYRKTASPQIHKSKRNKRGRVPKNDKPSFMVPSESRAKLLNRLVKRVGLAKHGWAQCAKALGGVRGFNAKWVTSSKGKKQAGTVRQETARLGAVFVMSNNVPYVSGLINSSGLRWALNQEKNFLRQQVAREIKRKW